MFLIFAYKEKERKSEALTTYNFCGQLIPITYKFQLKAGITYPIFTDTYIADLYFTVYCIYFFEPENFFCK